MTDTATTSLRGHALYRERMLLPPGSRLTVQLIDNQLADTPRAVLAESNVEGLSSPPFAFEIAYPAEAIRPNGLYGLHASIRGPDDRLLFVTDSRVPVNPGDGTDTEVMLKRVDGGASGSAAGGASTAHWQCGDLRVDARLHPGQGLAALSFSGRQLVLAAQGAGNRYGDDMGNTLDLGGEVVLLTLQGGTPTACTPADGPSPWSAAAERGIGFRAIGNEPGWSVEVSTGETPRLVADLDYGARRVVVARAQPAGLGFTGVAEDGATVQLAIEKTPCADAMSGEQFDATATLEVGGKTYRGCGAFLRR